MQSIDWVLGWACRRKCPHCYDDRYRPYVRDAPRAVVAEGQAAWPRIIVQTTGDIMTEERLTDILDDLAAEPAILTLNRGDPEAMGEAGGLSRVAFRESSIRVDPKGRSVANPYLGCDAYFRETLGDVLTARRAARLSAPRC